MISEMLLGFVPGMLNKYIGEYFENIDTSQLTGSLFGGGVTLNNVHLRQTIFENLGLPFHVVAGKCGTLEVRFSLRKLYSEPVIVNLKDLHVLVTPTRSVKYDAETEKQALQREKIRQLELFESIKKHVNQQTSQNSSASDAGKTQEITFVDTWIMQVVRNIEFQIESIHVRFEDDVTNKRDPFAVGVTLQSLSILTSDSLWKPQYIKEVVPDTMFKLVKLNGLSMYWNPAPTAMYKGIADQTLLFERLSVIPKARDHGFKFLFSPMNLELKVQVTPFPDSIQQPFSKPRLLLETRKNELMLSLSDKQFRDIFMFMDSIDLLITGHKFRKHRPDTPCKGHAKEWWKFAYKCAMDDISRKRNNFRWQKIAEHKQKCTSYIKAHYKKTIEKKSGAEIDKTVATLEEELDVFNLILLRKQVDLMKARQNSPGDYPVSDTSSWISSWFVTSSPPPALSASRASISSNEWTANEKQQLRMAVGFVNRMDVHNFPENYIDFETNIVFNELRVLIYRVPNRQRETVLEAVFDNLNFVFRTRPVGQGLQLELKMGRIEAYGGDFPRGAIDDAFAIPQIITTANPGVTEYFIKLMYEKAPLGSEVDHKVGVEGLALQFTYHAEAIQRLIDCFTLPKKEDMKTRPIPASTILNRILKFKASSTGRLLRMMENKGKVELSVCLVAPYIVIPMDVMVKGKANFIVVNLGEINIFGTLIGGTLCQNGGCSEFL